MTYIKNPEKIHFVRGGKYLCNHAVHPTPEKSTRLKERVKCKNCKFRLKMEMKNGKSKR